MSPAEVPDLLGVERFPRVSGDEPAIGGVKESFESFSPRERG